MSDMYLEHLRQTVPMLEELKQSKLKSYTLKKIDPLQFIIGCSFTALIIIAATEYILNYKVEMRKLDLQEQQMMFEQEMDIENSESDGMPSSMRVSDIIYNIHWTGDSMYLIRPNSSDTLTSVSWGHNTDSTLRIEGLDKAISADLTDNQ